MPQSTPNHKQASESPSPVPKPRTEKQIAASRRNGRKSKGPKTAEGKQRSSQNAMTHGATSVLAHRSRAEVIRRDCGLFSDGTDGLVGVENASLSRLVAQRDHIQEEIFKVMDSQNRGPRSSLCYEVFSSECGDANISKAQGYYSAIFVSELRRVYAFVDSYARPHVERVPAPYRAKDFHINLTLRVCETAFTCLTDIVQETPEDESWLQFSPDRLQARRRTAEDLHDRVARYVQREAGRQAYDSLDEGQRNILFGEDPELIWGTLSWILAMGIESLSEVQVRAFQDLVAYAARLIKRTETELVPVRYARSFSVLADELGDAEMDKLDRLYRYLTTLNRQITLQLERIEGLKRCGYASEPSERIVPSG